MGLSLDLVHAIVIVATLVMVIAIVMLHYESFVLLNRAIERQRASHRRRILLLVFGLLLAHVAEIGLFGVVAWWLAEYEGVGGLVGLRYSDLTLEDYLFMSAVTYTTLGYGDIVPIGAIRFLYGSEALAGFVMITWSASFAFLEMQKHWRIDKQERREK